MIRLYMQAQGHLSNFVRIVQRSTITILHSRVREISQHMTRIWCPNPRQVVSARIWQANMLNPGNLAYEDHQVPYTS